MALFDNNFNTKERMQPGFDGKLFEANLPGYRDGAERMNRTNNNLNTSQHDVPNIKFAFDKRLPALFKYGFAFGFNQIVIPKGRLVAVDPHLDIVDFESRKKFSTLTLANGGIPVRLRKQGDKYLQVSDATSVVTQQNSDKQVPHVGKEWTPAHTTLTELYSEDKKVMRPHQKTVAEQMTAADVKVDTTTGLIVKNDGSETEQVTRPANIPIGMIERNEYTRDDDAFNGMMPGPVLTDAMVELPWFTHKDMAEGNPWGSAYGAMFPGALVRSDENGRFVLSALSFPEQVKAMSIAEYEAERQQVVGQVYAINHELVPEGAAKWATWALEDRLNSEEFNPTVYAKTNRRGEDAVNNSPFNSKGEYPGYPYDKNYMNHDLHMLASSMGGTYDPRMNPEFQYSDLGIPGLTDGRNVVVKEVKDQEIGLVHYAGEDKEYVDMFFRTIDVNVEGIKIKVNGKDETEAKVGAKIGSTGLVIRYADNAQGIIVLGVDDKGAAKTTLEKGAAKISVSYKKRGEAGVPTFLDWEGAVGSVKVLLTK